MSIEVERIIKINLNGKDLSLTEEDARQIYAELHRLFDKDAPTIPWLPAPPSPEHPVLPLYPPCPLITC